MTIKIQTKQDYIPIQLGDEEIRFHISDDSILKIRTGAEKVQEEIEAIEASEDEEIRLEQMRLILKKGFDFLFEEGTFDRIYKISPSVVVCVEYLDLMVGAVLKELENRGITNKPNPKINKYLNKTTNKISK